jgi:protein-disulfide isomerase
VRNVLRLFTIVMLACCAVIAAPGQQASTNAPAAGSSPSQVQKDVAAYLRHLYAFGADVQLVVGAPKDTGVTGIQEVTIDLKIGENAESTKMYVSKDGKFLFRGELSDMTKDPLAESRALLQTANSPMLGDPHATVTLVEYSDFECPVCRSLHDALRGLLPNYPQVRVIFKDFPIENLHPWARTAALAGRCSYHQDPKAFWKVYDLIYDSQDVISAENAWSKMNDYASQAGLNVEAFKSCLAAPKAAAEVDASVANAKQLEVSSTPTIFVNGRRIVGADPHLLQQYIDYELAQLKAAGGSEKK